jgi:hypothetical protein
MLMAIASAHATTWYVDSGAGGANNGTSWGNAWTSVGSVAGVKAGDVVYISGGPTGQTRSYSGGWTPAGGNSSASIIYQIGQDSAHNGTAVFDCAGGSFLGNVSYVTISGDAGDGNMHFSLINAGYVAALQNSFNVTISYLNMGAVTEGGGNQGGVIDANPVSGLQIDHCSCVVWDTIADHFSYILSNTSAYDANRAFNNTIYLPKGAYGYGADGFQWNGSGLTMANNYVCGYLTNYTGSQHQDGYQGTSGQYLKIYNNTFRDMGNSGVFLDGYWGNFINCMVYNNLIYLSISVPSGAYPRGMDIISDHAAVSGPITFQNVMVCNNLVANYPSLYGLGFYAPATGNGSTYINCVAANNVCYNTQSGFDIDSAAGLSSYNNKYIPSGNGSSFVNYSTLSSSSASTPFDFHLSASDTLLRGQGANLSSYFSIDKDNNARPATGAWDLGPYQYGSTGGTGGPPSTYLTVAPMTDNAVDVVPSQPGIHVYGGTAVQFSDSLSYNGTNTVYWQWTYSVNGGSQVSYTNGTGTTIPTVSYNFPVSGAGNTYTLQLSATAGALSSSSSASIIDVAPTNSSPTNYQPPVVSDITQSDTDVLPNVLGVHIYAGTLDTYSATASSPIGLPLTWQWTYTLNGGSPAVFQSGSGTVLPVTFTYGLGTAGSTYVWTLQVSDGQTTVSSPQLTMNILAPPTPGTGLTFAATNGAVTAPFAVTGNYISQAVQTTVIASAGQANFSFTITNAGLYVIQALVNAPNDAANSFYVNIDALPVDPTMCWDIEPLTSGFEQRLVSWRGIGTDTANQYNPKMFNLSAGSHQITFCGREAGTQLQSFSFLKVPQAPQGLQVVVSP